MCDKLFQKLCKYNKVMARTIEMRSQECTDAQYTNIEQTNDGYVELMVSRLDRKIKVIS